MAFQKKIRFIHKWLGLTSGLIVFIVSITGCLFCFQDEIKDITREEIRFVKDAGQPYLDPSALREKALEVIPKAKSELIFYVARNRSAVVYTHNNKGNFYVFLNPYTGQHLYTEDPTTDFFMIVEYIHLYLLLPNYIGKHIVGGATIIFILLLITGLMQWWPKKRTDLKKRLSVKWSAKWRRINYDWHNVSGFYLSLAGIIIAITGLVFAYDWVGDGLYYTANLGQGNKEIETQHPSIDTTKFKSNSTHAADKAFGFTLKNHPQHEMFYVVFPQKKKDPIETGAYPYALRFDHQSNYHFHPQTGTLLTAEPYEHKSLGLQLNEMNYGIHTGQILNLPGKIMAFTASLIFAALPVTGLFIWYGRRKKTKRS
jgi:uncharacterized iron-regulated membrane protein